MANRDPNTDPPRLLVKATRPHWVKDNGQDDPTDLCLHSPMLIEVGERSLLTPDDGDWAVSSAALHLLRTVTTDHTPECPVGGQLIPHCGHSFYPYSADTVVIPGDCPASAELWIKHQGGTVLVGLTADDATTIHWKDWARAILQLSDAVRTYYFAGAAKEPPDAWEAECLDMFWKEWTWRVQAIEERLRDPKPGA